MVGLRLVVTSLAERIAEPLKTFVETVTAGSAGGLDVLQHTHTHVSIAIPSLHQSKRNITYPCPLPQTVQPQLIRNLSRIHRIRQILLVGEDQQQRVPQLILIQHTLQLLARLDNTVAIIAVDDEDDALRVLEVVSPERADLVLPAHIPDGELNVLVFDRLNVEAWCGRPSVSITRVKGDEGGVQSGGGNTYRWWG